MIKVVVVVPGLEVGGAEQDIVRNFPRLDRDAFDVVVVSFSSRGVLGAELERQGVRVVSRLEQEADERVRRRRWTWRRPAMSRAWSIQTSLAEVRRWLRCYVPRRERAVPSGRRTVFRLGDALRSMYGGVTLPLRRAVGAYHASRFRSSILARLGTARYIARVILWLGRTLEREGADVVHFFLPYSYIYGMCACLFLSVRPKRVMSRLSTNFYQDSHRLAGWIERNVLHRMADRAVGNSNRILDELRTEGVPVARLRLLHNGIDPSPFERRDGERQAARLALTVADARLVLVAVGNLHVYKGHADLIEAFALARPSMPERSMLLVAGHDIAGNLARYERRVADLGLGDRVHFLGATGDVPRLLLAADLFVHPSHHEGLPNAVIEAMAASLPVVATRVGGLPELVIPRGEDEATGWLVPPSDPASLAGALVEAAVDPEARAAMGARARARVAAHFSLERSVRTYEALYRELVPQRMLRS